MEEKSVPSETLGMDKYINRKDAIYAAKHAWAKGIEPSQYIEIIPSADVAPVRHGRWNDGDPYCPICRKDKFRGLDADVWADWKPDYCPNCGAKMDGGIKTDG